MNKYRILALDGGGIRGLVAITLLKRLEEEVPGWIDKVDLLAGTSTGAIIAVGLAMGASPSELFQHYYDLAQEIFCHGRQIVRGRIRKIVRPEYDTRGISAVMQRLLGDKKLRDLPKKVMITTFDLDNDRQELHHRSWEPKFLHNLNEESDFASLPVYKAILYSCATPVYFPSVDGFIDGAVTSQNPSLVALAHAVDETVAVERTPTIDDVFVLSLGCGRTNRYLPGDRHNWGYAQWTRLLVDMMLEGSVDLVDRVCKQLLGTRYHRICPEMGDTVHADEWWKRDELAVLGGNVDITGSEGWLKQSWL